MERIPILKLDQFLIVTLTGDITDQMAIQFQMNVLEKIYDTKAVGLLMDISTLDMVDSFLGRVISETAKMAKLLGTETILCGMRPGVAITLVDLGVEINSVTNSLTLEHGLEKLRLLVQKNRISVEDATELLGEEEDDCPSD